MMLNFCVEKQLKVSIINACIHTLFISLYSSMKTDLALLNPLLLFL